MTAGKDAPEDCGCARVSIAETYCPTCSKPIKNLKVKALEAKLREMDFRYQTAMNTDENMRYLVIKDLQDKLRKKEAECERFQKKWEAEIEAHRAVLKSPLTQSIKDMEAQLQTARELLNYFHEDSDCSFDHHGYCQEHSYFNSGICIMKQVANFLEAVRKV